MRSILVLSLLYVPVIPAQQRPSDVGNPVLGIVFDATEGAVRPLLGVPGSATLGPAHEAGPALALTAVALDIAVGIEAETGAAVLISALGRSNLNIPAGAARIAISPRGQSAAFYYADAAKIRLLSGLPDNPRFAGEVDIPGNPSLLAVRDDGARVIAVLPGADGDELLAGKSTGELRISKRMGHVTAVAFTPGGSKALLAEAEANRVWWIGDFGRELGLVADEHDEIAGVVAVAAFADGRGAIVAMSDGRIAIRRASDGQQIVVSCGCEPTELTALRGGAAFRLNAGVEGPTWILDSGGTEPAVMFVARSEGGRR